MARSRQKIGWIGECAACMFFFVRGYRIVGRNIKVGRGELDIVIRRGKELRVVEVRTVTTRFLQDATQAVDAKKRRQVLKLAQQYFSQHGRQEDCFYCDIVGVRLYWGFVPYVRWLRAAIGDF